MGLAGADPYSLYLTYRAGDHWRKLDKLAVFTGAGTVQGEMPVNLLTKCAVIALAGGSPAKTPPASSGMILLIAGDIVAAGVLLALAAGILIVRNRRHAARLSTG